jgi:hypothetical protein
VSYAPNQLANARAALTEVRRRGLDRVAEQQTFAGMLDECTLLNYANPLYPWTLAVSDGYPPGVLAPSTKESCGVFQQRPHDPVWWGPQGLSIHDQALYFMDVRQAVGLFLDRLVGTTRTDQPWREIQLVQGSEYDGRPGYPYAANYQAQWAAAGALINLLDSTGGTPPTGTLIDWITRMTTPTDQAELAAFKTDIVAGVVAALTQGSSSELFLNRMYYSGQADNRGQDTANKAATADAQSPVTSRQDHKDYPKNMFLSGMDEKTSANGAAIAELAQTLVSLAARLDAIAATLAAQDAAVAAK